MLQPQGSSWFKIVIPVLLGIVAIIAVILFNTSLPKKTSFALLPEPRNILPFQLSANNKKLLSEKSFDHHWTFIFFGFTHCSDVCPTTLAILKDAYLKLHTHYPDVQVVFVSVDPENDQVRALQKYVASFNKDFIGVTGTSEQLEKLQRQLGVFVGRDGAAINHTNSVFLINPKGQWVALFPYGTRSEQFYSEFRSMVT